MTEGIVTLAALGALLTDSAVLLAAWAALILLLVAAFLVFIARERRLWPPPFFVRAKENPILTPVPEYSWESQAVFNPAALLHNDRIHLFYRALGADGVSRIGHASSRDGIHFDERSPFPVYAEDVAEAFRSRHYYTSPVPPTYNPVLYASGGGWGGSEDPRVVSIGNRVLLTYSSFRDWSSIRILLTTLAHEDFDKREWKWSRPSCLSPHGKVHKNWVLFPEKVNDRYAILHTISPKVCIHYEDEIDGLEHGLSFESVYHPHDASREGEWDAHVRGAGAPPIKTSEGWLLFYHAINPKDPGRYKVGAMLLDLTDPTIVRHRSQGPVLEPAMPYENDWKPGVVYCCGAVVKDDKLFLYYGGGDKTVNVVTAPLSKFLDELKRGKRIKLSSRYT